MKTITVRAASANAQAAQPRTRKRRSKITAEHLTGDCVHLWLTQDCRNRLSKLAAQVQQSINAEVSASVLLRASLWAMERYMDNLVANERPHKSGELSFAGLELHKILSEARTGVL